MNTSSQLFREMHQMGTKLISAFLYLLALLSCYRLPSSTMARGRLPETLAFIFYRSSHQISVPRVLWGVLRKDLVLI